jgi:hypothetical protein
LGKKEFFKKEKRKNISGRKRRRKEGSCPRGGVDGT